MGLFRKKKKPVQPRKVVSVPLSNIAPRATTTTTSSALAGGTVTYTGGVPGVGPSVDADCRSEPIAIKPPGKPLPKVTIYVYPDTGDLWRWRLKKGNNKNFAVSGESFASKASATRAANSLSALIPGSTVHVEDPAKKKAPAKKKT